MEHGESSQFFVATDVGTGSVRSAVFSQDGTKVTSTQVYPIKTQNLKGDHYEQATSGATGVWAAVVSSIRAACAELDAVDNSGGVFDVRDRIGGIGFDATCSLVAVESKTGNPVSVVEQEVAGGASSPNTASESPSTVYDVVLWLDHRALKETEAINASESEVVKSVRRHFGGRFSPENEPGKLLHLKKHMPPEAWASTSFFDLADWLAFKCVGKDIARSSCTVACKWGWGSGNDDGHASSTGWNCNYWKAIDLADLADDNYRRIGSQVVPPGACLGTLSDSVAMQLGLPQRVVVAAPLIDAHCGALGMLSPGCSEMLVKYAPKIENRLAMICGTSTCHLAVNKQKIFVDGVWGPFRDAILNQYWVTEGGQSATGVLLDHVIERSPASALLKQEAARKNTTIYSLLESIIADLEQIKEEDLCQDFHVLPYFHGNRSPRADPTLKGCISGLTLSSSHMQARDELATTYKATVQALAYGTRHIIEEMNRAGHDLRAVIACGGLANSQLFMSELADACNMPVFCTQEPDAVLSGGAILAACAASRGQVSVEHLMDEMTKMNENRTFLPKSSRTRFHDRKYRVFLRMYDDQMSYRKTMRDCTYE